MRLGVISTHTPVSEDAGAGWLPGAYRGGAELSDAEYLEAAPSGVEWEYTTAASLDRFDRILVTSIDHLGPAECEVIGERGPVVFMHHAVQAQPWHARLVSGARAVMVHTPAHEALVRRWSSPRRVELVLSAIDSSRIVAREEREPFALVACRQHPLKGVKNAKLWAAREGYDLVVMHRESREVVLDAMSRAEVFVHLPLAFESEGRAVIEAVLAGCRVVANDFVGVTSVPGWNDPTMIRHLVDTAADRYWGVVCE